MQPVRHAVALMTLGLMTAAVPAQAAWDNVFQVTCFGHRRGANSSPAACCPPVVASSSPCCDPCPQTQCTTKYVQRCYYQPVTTYQTQTYYEPVTTYTTKTYYEPVTTYRYSCYYDPCSCSYQKVAVPCTSYVARQQCCPVQSWVARCVQVPVTSYQKSFYWEPQTTCCTTSGGGCNQPPQVYGQPGAGGYQTQPPPQVDGKSSGGSDTDKYYGGQQSQQRQLSPNGPLPGTPNKSQSPGLKFERIAVNDGPGVQGQIVNDAKAPKAGVKVTFVSASKQAADQTVTADAAGNFNVQLPAGEWLVYLRTADGQQVYHSRLEVTGAQQKTPIVLVSR